jgi:hypothetical protein
MAALPCPPQRRTAALRLFRFRGCSIWASSSGNPVMLAMIWMCRAARFKYLENRDGGAALSAQRAKLATAQTVAVERRNALDAGDLVYIGLVRRTLEADYGVMREIALGVPGKIADSLQPHSALDRGVIAEIVRLEIYEMLENLSNYENYPPVVADNAKSPGKPRPKRATNKPKRAAR